MDAPGWLEVSQPKPFVYMSPAETCLLLARRERWTLTQIIHWLRPLFLPWRAEATVAIWSEKLAKLEKHPAGSEAQSRMQFQAFYQITI